VGYAAGEGWDEAGAGCAARPLPAAASELLAQYFTSKLDDFAVIRAALMVGRCRWTLSKSLLKAPMVSVLEASI
jgi:hypothetical protein